MSDDADNDESSPVPEIIEAVIPEDELPIDKRESGTEANFLDDGFEEPKRRGGRRGGPGARRLGRGLRETTSSNNDEQADNIDNNIVPSSPRHVGRGIRGTTSTNDEQAADNDSNQVSMSPRRLGRGIRGTTSTNNDEQADKNSNNNEVTSKPRIGGGTYDETEEIYDNSEVITPTRRTSATRGGTDTDNKDRSNNNNNGTEVEVDKERPSLADQQEAIIALNEQMVAQQEQTIKVLHELSTTIKNLMVAQMRKEKDSEVDAKEILEVDRATVRLDGLEVYAVVSALTVATSIACFDAYGADHTEVWEGHFDGALFTLVWNTAFLFVSATGIITGLHATLVFSLMTMYGRTAVGVSHDVAFVEFFVQTGRVRYRGFQTFRISLYSFLFQVLFMITAKTSPWLRPISVAINLYAMSRVYEDTQSVIDKASAILFQAADSNESPKGLQRTLSDGSDGSRARSTSPVPRRGRGGPRGGPAATRTARGEAEASDKPTSSVKKGVARTKSGFVVYDVGPQQVRRGGRKPKGL